MGLLDGFKAWRAERQFKKFTRNLSHSINSRLESGRQTHEKWEKQFSWYEDIMINRNEFRNKDVMESLKIIRDLNPDASMAIWNFLRLSNTGHELECLKPTGSNDKQGLDYINGLAKRVGALYGGGMDQLINVLNLTGFTQGAICLEVELNEGLNDVVDFHAVDPSTVDFRKDKETDEVQLVQKQSDGTYKVLNREQVFYLPFDPDIGDPYGRSPILPILQIVFFQVEVLKDLKAVAHNQGHARLDISVAEEAILKNIPQEVKMKGAQAIAEYAQTFVTSIENRFKQLKADDNFFHSDSVKLAMVGGTSGKSMDATALINIINQQLVSALKQLPILLGRNEGATETHGTVQWQIYVAGIESIQRGVKRVIERAYNVALQVQGKQSKARLTFNKLRTTDRFQDAQAEQIETNTWISRVQQGWVDNNEAANEVVGHNAVGEPQAPITSSLGLGRSRHYQIKKSPKIRATDKEDEFVSGIKDNWASDIAKLTTNAQNAFHRLLKAQKNRYITRLKEADDPPTRMLLDASRGIRADEDEPSGEFEEWVKVNILTDEGEQLELWEEEGFNWIEQAAIIAGQIALLELDTDIEFNAEDESLLRALSERSKRDAKLIQGVTDEDVIMTLWDVVSEGKYSISKAVSALEDAYSFSKDRAETIARTEMIGAARTGQFEGDRQSGIVIGKQWFSAHQSNTRKGHKKADGQIRPFDVPFDVRNDKNELEQLMFPGDSSLDASASNTIQCRCGYTRILEGEEDKMEGWENT